MNTGPITPEIEELQEKLFSSILIEHQKINKVRPPEQNKKELLLKSLSDFEKVRGKGFYYNYFSTGNGHGPFTELVDGSVKYDLITGIGFNLLGHSHPLCIKSLIESTTSDTLMVGNLQPYNDTKEITEEIVSSVSKSRLEHFWFAGSGSFANDLALKLIWQKKNPKFSIIAFEKNFAGRSVATQDITFNQALREGMPKNLDVHYAPHFNQKDPDNAITQTLDSLNQIWEKAGNTIGAMVIELVQGEGGFVFGPPEYYRAIFDWAREKDIIIWVDEVQTFARTHELFAFQMFGLDEYPDIVTVAKALQCCGILYTKEMNPKPGLIAGTFCSAIPNLKFGKKILQYLKSGPFYGKDGQNAKLQQNFMSRFEKLANGSCQGKIPYYNGVGTMISFEVGDSGPDTTKNFLQKLFENGVIGFPAGKNPTRARFLLPLCLTEEHLDEIFQIIEKTILEVI